MAYYRLYFLDGFGHIEHFREFEAQTDLAAIVRANDNDQLAKIVTEHIRALPGITTSETLIAFRVYSRHDLERMFSIGMEKG